MNARLFVAGRREENRFRLRLKDGRPYRVQVGDDEWLPVPEGAWPTCAYLPLLRAGVNRYEAFVEGSRRVEPREIKAEGDLLVEYAEGRATRKFQMESDRIVYICWGGPAESRLVPAKADALRGTVFE